MLGLPSVVPELSQNSRWMQLRSYGTTGRSRETFDREQRSVDTRTNIVVRAASRMMLTLTTDPCSERYRADVGAVMVTRATVIRDANLAPDLGSERPWSTKTSSFVISDELRRTCEPRAARRSRLGTAPLGMAEPFRHCAAGDGGAD
jgi:hypothetical protein